MKILLNDLIKLNVIFFLALENTYHKNDEIIWQCNLRCSYMSQLIKKKRKNVQLQICCLDTFCVCQIMALCSSLQCIYVAAWLLDSINSLDRKLLPSSVIPHLYVMNFLYKHSTTNGQYFYLSYGRAFAHLLSSVNGFYRFRSLVYI
jgi:hypothetical protein